MQSKVCYFDNQAKERNIDTGREKRFMLAIDIYNAVKNEILKIYEDIIDNWSDVPIYHFKEYRPMDYNEIRSKLEKLLDVWVFYFDFSKDRLTDYNYIFNILMNICPLFEIQIDEKMRDDVQFAYKKKLSQTKFDGITYAKIVKLLSCNKFNDIYEGYKKDYSFVKSLVVIKAFDELEPLWRPIDLVLKFKSKNKLYIFSPYFNNKINCVCHQTLNTSNDELITARAYSFDTNVVSYWKSRILKKKLDVDIEQVFQLIYNSYAQYDYMPYLLENKLFKNIDPLDLRKNLMLIEKDIYDHNNDYKKKQSFKEYFETQLKKLDNLNYKFYLKSYNELYCQLLAFAYIALSKEIKMQNKIISFLNLLEYELAFDINYPFLYMAADYFNKEEIRFFKKIQPSAKNILHSIKNMSWDIFHLQTQIVSLCNPDSETEILIPYFCTCDKDLFDISKYFQIDTIAYSSTLEEVFIKYHYCSYVLLPEKYKNKIYHRNLNQFNNEQKVYDFINKMEKIISDKFN